MTDLCTALQSMTDEGRIRVEARSEPSILLDADTAVPLGIVLTEVVTNAVKYAFPTPRTGTILGQALGQARRSMPGRIELEVKDDGVGVAKAREGSLGYGLFRALIQQLGGMIKVSSEDGVTVQIP